MRKLSELLDKLEKKNIEREIEQLHKSILNPEPWVIELWLEERTKAVK